MKRRLFLVMLPIILLAALPASSQSSDCDVDSAQTTFRDMLSAVTSISDLQAISSGLSGWLARCNDRAGDGEGNGVLGPYELEPGAYVLRYTYQTNDVGISGFVVKIENVDTDESENAAFEMGSLSGEDAGKERSGSGFFRIEGGTYLVVVKVDHISQWSIEIIEP